MKKIITNSSEETKKLAENLAKQITRGVIALSGDLGSGKTTFVQGFAKGLGIKDKIISPTFVLIKQYKNLYHVDLYRINTFDHLGLEEILSNRNNIVLIEWAEKLKKLPDGSIKINITKCSDQKRTITIEPTIPVWI